MDVVWYGLRCDIKTWLLWPLSRWIRNILWLLTAQKAEESRRSSDWFCCLVLVLCWTEVRPLLVRSTLSLRHSQRAGRTVWNDKEQRNTKMHRSLSNLVSSFGVCNRFKVFQVVSSLFWTTKDLALPSRSKHCYGKTIVFIQGWTSRWFEKEKVCISPTPFKISLVLWLNPHLFPTKQNYSFSWLSAD